MSTTLAKVTSLAVLLIWAVAACKYAQSRHFVNIDCNAKSNA